MLTTLNPHQQRSLLSAGAQVGEYSPDSALCSGTIFEVVEAIRNQILWQHPFGEAVPPELEAWVEKNKVNLITVTQTG